jgi:transketolase
MMALQEDRKAYLRDLCGKFRNTLIDILYKAQSGHPGGSLSATELITTLYFEKMRIDPKNPSWEDRDRFILGKGHGAPMLYINLAGRGYFPAQDLQRLRQFGCHLQGHPCAKDTPGVELSTGPLGLGLGAGVGMALGGKLGKKDFYTYVLMGDGEIQEGIIWEAAMAAHKFGLDHLIGILDHNGVQLDGTVDEIMPLGDVRAKWEAFGWKTIVINGHDVEAVSDAVDKAKTIKGSPIIIIANTVKGKGVSFMEGKNGWHGKPIGPDDYKAAKAELAGGK